MKLPIKDLFSKCNQIGKLLRIWLHLMKELLMEDFILSSFNKGEKVAFHSLEPCNIGVLTIDLS